MKKEIERIQQPTGAIVEAKEVSSWEIGGAIALLLFATVPLIVGWLFLRQRQFDLHEFVAVTLLGIYSFAVIITFAIILLWGFKRLELSESFVKWLGGATLAEVAGMVLCVVKYLFANK